MVDIKIEVLMNEMTAIKNEVDTTKGTIHSILNFFFVLTGAEVALFVAILEKPINFNNFFIRFLILIIPILFKCLSLYQTECVIRIHRYCSYIDSSIRNKLEELLGEPLLNSKSKNATKTILDVFRESPLDAKFGYISKLGIKVISMLLPCIFYFCFTREHEVQITVVEYFFFSIDALLILLLFFMQHD